MTPDAVIIRQATPADAAVLAGFAEYCFRDAFAEDNTPEDMDRYVASVFTVDVLGTDISDPNGVVYVAEFDARLVGYAHVRRGPTPDCVEASSPVEVKRFYIARTWHGLGLAQRLMRRVLDSALNFDADVVWLAVWERNPRAIAFYSKAGFVDTGSQPFMLGGDSQTDRVMCRAARG